METSKTAYFDTLMVLFFLEYFDQVELVFVQLVKFKIYDTS